MRMVRLYNKEDLQTFPRDKWNLLDPPEYYEGNLREQAPEDAPLDLVIVPGLAFDEKGHRLGKGKGYYDRFLSHTINSLEAKGLQKPYLMGIAFSCQKVELVPCSSFDILVDQVIFP